jgi:murein DD-endopeptidase MepM/ murein hydrolase activator NlpD
LTPRIPERDVSRLRRGRLLIGAAVAALCVGGGVASAQTSDEGDGAAADPLSDVTDEVTTDPGTATDEGQAQGEAEQADPATDEQTDPAAGEPTTQRATSSLRLSHEDVSRSKIFFNGRREVQYRFEIGGGRGDLKVAVVKRGSGDVVKRWSRGNVDPGERKRVNWHGERGNGGEAKKGEYFFRVRERGVGKLSRQRSKGSRDVKLYPAIFPVRGRHQYWDGWGAGRGHRGQDIGAKCGTEMVAARAGKVAYKAYDGGGYGYYVVINDKTRNHAYVYAHLKRKARVRKGSIAKAGERIGSVGQSGNASGCHLHFEYWDGKWGRGGHATPKATKRLRGWDRWS